jgi:ribonuclease R
MGADRGSADPLAPYLALLERKAPRPLSIAEMVRLLGVARYDQRVLRAALKRAVERRDVRRIGKTRYQWVRAAERRPLRTASRRRDMPPALLSGRYTRVRAGYGFVALGTPHRGFEQDVLVPAGMEGDARHGDEVLVEIVRRDPRSRRAVGRVTTVTGRVRDTVIGTLERRGRRWLLIPLNDLDPPLALGGAELTPAQEGMVALARPTTASGAALPGGTLERVLGDADDPEVQVLCIVAEFGLRSEFPAAVAAEAARLPTDPSAADVAGRRDLRALSFVTIDGETARDFDDAVCAEPLADGGVRLWVAIADVAHYVRPSSALDAEAAARGTSVYFPDRAIPMLPPRLSNELCSLNPERERLVLVVELLYDRAGARRGAECYRAVMRSRARLTYTAVAAVLSETDTTEIRAQRSALAPMLPMLERMRALMGQLYERRVRAGSLDLDLPDALIDLSDAGRGIGVRLEQRNDAHRLIEEFMLEANRAVAERLRASDIPFPYRIHEAPASDDIDELNELLAPYGVAVDHDGPIEPRDVQRALDRLQGHRLARVLSRQVLRALRQARYSTINAGHFGLAFPIYCHFTSPIRRYPDLLVHRQLGRLFDGDDAAARAEAGALETASLHSSQAERTAMEAERAMVDLKKCEFMLAHLLEPDEATVVSVIKAGLFVELDAYPVEGLVRADTIPGDRWYFLEQERALKGVRTRQRYRLGDRLVVEATSVSLRRRQIDFAIVRRLEPGGPAKPDREIPARASARSPARPRSGSPSRSGRPAGAPRGAGRRRR